MAKRKKKDPAAEPARPAAPPPRRAPSREEIGALAHRLWEEAGRPEGRALDHWIEAERRLASRA